MSTYATRTRTRYAPAVDVERRTFKFSPELLDRIRKSAEGDRRSMNAQVVTFCEEALAAREQAEQLREAS